MQENHQCPCGLGSTAGGFPEIADGGQATTVTASTCHGNSAPAE